MHTTRNVHAWLHVSFTSMSCLRHMPFFGVFSVRTFQSKKGPWHLIACLDFDFMANRSQTARQCYRHIVSGLVVYTGSLNKPCVFDMWRNRLATGYRHTVHEYNT